MNAHRSQLDTAPALIEKATDLMARIHRLAPHTRPTLRLRLMGELSLCGRVLEEIEELVAANAQFTIAAMKPRAPAFKGGRGLLPAPRGATEMAQLAKEKMAGRPAVVIWKENHGDELVTMRLDDWLVLVKERIP